MNNTSPQYLDTIELFTEKHSSECVCKNCGTSFLARRSKVLCKNCYETALFAQVKKYIQQNEVTEFEVANYFRIPLRLVKKWIREGRIDYKEHNLATTNKHCRTCGTPISFGNYCSDCLRFLDTNLFQSELNFSSELQCELSKNNPDDNEKDSALSE